MAGEGYLIDSNILIRWVKPDATDYSLLNQVIETLLQRGDLLFYTSQNLAEFWNACTRPVERNGFGLTSEETDARATLIEGALQILPDLPEVHLVWRRLIVRYRVSGVQVHDARLVASMIVHGVRRILTFNDRDFSRYPEIEALHPRMLSGNL